MSYDTYGAYIRAQEIDRIVAAIDRLTSVMALSTLLREGGRQVSPEWVGEYVRVMKAITQLAALDKEADR